jgi:hypothetical protein
MHFLDIKKRAIANDLANGYGAQFVLQGIPLVLPAAIH